MAYEQKLEKLGKVAAEIHAIVAEDQDLRLQTLNTEDDEQEGFRIIIVIRHEPHDLGIL